MGNQEAETRIELDKVRTLTLDFNTIKDFENATNKNFWDLEGKLTGTDTLALLWACLRQEDELLTQHAVGKMVPVTKWTMVSKKLGALMEQVLPDKSRKGRRDKKNSPLAAEE